MTSKRSSLPENPFQKSFLFFFREGTEVFVVLAPGPAVVDDFVDGTPVREASDGTVINEEVGVKLTGADAGFVDFFARVVAVDGKEFEATLFTKIYGILQ